MTHEQRCWVHKTANVLAKLPKETWMAETKVDTEAAFDAMIGPRIPSKARSQRCATAR
jgi:putative transposase